MQPGEWLQLPNIADAPPQPLPPPRIAASNKSLTTSTRKKNADPFAVPDNEYNDSFLDSLWINLFATRMSAAVEAESFASTVARKARSAGAPTELQVEQWPAAAAAAAAAVRARRLREEGGSGGDTAAVEKEITVAKSELDGFETIAIADREERNLQNYCLKSATAKNVGIGNSVVDRIDSSPSVNFSAGSGAGTDWATAAAAREGAKGEHHPLPEGVGSTADRFGYRRRELARQDAPADAVNTTAIGSGGVGRSVGGGGMDVAYTYDDYVALATKLQAGPPERQRQVVRGVLRSIFPKWFPAFYRTLFPPSKVGLTNAYSLLRVWSTKGVNGGVFGLGTWGGRRLSGGRAGYVYVGTMLSRFWGLFDHELKIDLRRLIHCSERPRQQQLLHATNKKVLKA